MIYVTVKGSEHLALKPLSTMRPKRRRQPSIANPMPDWHFAPVRITVDA